MVKGDVNKPKGKTSAYAFFVQTYLDEHRRKSPDVPINFSEFSPRIWRSDESSTELHTRGVGKKKDPKRPPSAFFIFCAAYRPTVKSQNPSLSIGEIAKKLGELWSKQSISDRAPFEQKAVRLREKYEKEVAAYRAGGGATKRGPGRPTGSTKKSQAEDDDDDEEDEDEEDDEDDDDE